MYCYCIAIGVHEYQNVQVALSECFYLYSSATPYSLFIASHHHNDPDSHIPDLVAEGALVWDGGLDIGRYSQSMSYELDMH